MASNNELEHNYGKAGFEMNGNNILMFCIAQLMLSFATHDLIDNANNKKGYLPILLK